MTDSNQRQPRDTKYGQAHINCGHKCSILPITHFILKDMELYMLSFENGSI